MDLLDSMLQSRQAKRNAHPYELVLHGSVCIVMLQHVFVLIGWIVLWCAGAMEQEANEIIEH